jgi:hypothetical protein
MVIEMIQRPADDATVADIMAELRFRQVDLVSFRK